jgi:hypothetical protein
MAVRISCVLHFFLILFLSGCGPHGIVGSFAFQDKEITEARDFTWAVEDKLPLWDTDALGPYERLEIATVKDDIAMARRSTERSAILRCVRKLRDDWEALIALDELLRKARLT